MRPSRTRRRPRGKVQRDPKREAYWRDALGRQKGSGLSVRAFCAGEGIAETASHAWRRIPRGREREKQQAGGSAVPAFMPVVVRPERSRGAESVEASIAIELRGGRVMRLAASMPAEPLARIVHAVEGLPAAAEGAA